MIKLNTVEILLAKILLESVGKIRSYYYKELAEMVTPKLNPHTQLPNHIGRISELCYELDLPMISAKVINATTNTAGDGFYKLYCSKFPNASKLTPIEVWKNELIKIRECQEWYKLSEYLGLHIDFKNPNVEIKDAQPQQIRILPMSHTQEFVDWSIKRLQSQYFLNELINNSNGEYYYQTGGMDAGNNSLVLFQFRGFIVASAVLLNIKKFSNIVEEKYHGCYLFDVNTIKVFEPISVDELSDIDSNVKRFTQTKQIISYSKLGEIEKLIEDKQTTVFPNEILDIQVGKYIEGAKKMVIVNFYERNDKARRDCVKANGHICKICKFDFSGVYGDEFEGKIHVHHIKPLSEIDETYEVDPVNDLIPVCPNCHMVLHSKKNGVYTVDEVKKMLNKHTI